LPQPFIDAEGHEMGEVVIGPTVDRSVVGTMNEFIFKADNAVQHSTDLFDLSLRLAHTPCYQRGKFFGFPD